MVSLLILSLGLFSILDRAELMSLCLEARSVLKDSNPEIQIDRHGIKWKLCPFCDFRFPCDQGEDVLLFHVASGHMQNDDEFMATYDRVGRDESKIVLKEGTFHLNKMFSCILDLHTTYHADGRCWTKCPFCDEIFEHDPKYQPYLSRMWDCLWHVGTHHSSNVQLFKSHFHAGTFIIGLVILVLSI